MFDINIKNSLPVIIGVIIIIMIIVYFVLFYKNKEQFAIIVPNYQTILNSLPSQTEQNLIDKIVNDIEICFNPSYVSTLTPDDLNILNNNFLRNWVDNILDGIKNKLYYNEILQARDSSLNLEETLMSKYYKNVIKTLTNAYCLPDNNNYSKFLSLYTSELKKIVNHIECLIRKVQFIKTGTLLSEISINKQELFYQVECIQQFIYSGLRNQMADPIGFYEKLYDLIMNAGNADYNFCSNTAIDYDIDINNPIKNPININGNCKDLTSSFITPYPTINPNACIIGTSCTNKTPIPHVQTIPPMIMDYNNTPIPFDTPSPTGIPQITQRVIPQTTQDPQYAAILARELGFSSVQTKPFDTSVTINPLDYTSITSSSITPPISTPTLDGNLEILSVKPAQMDNLAGMNESINFQVPLEILNTQQPNSQMNFNPIYQNQNTNQNITMTKPYQTTHSSLPFSFKIKNTKNSNDNNIMPMNTNDFDNFAEYQLTHPKINLLAAKGPNNFFIPNIWIEE